MIISQFTTALGVKGVISYKTTHKVKVNKFDHKEHVSIACMSTMCKYASMDPTSDRVKRLMTASGIALHSCLGACTLFIGGLGRRQ